MPDAMACHRHLCYMLLESIHSLWRMQDAGREVASWHTMNLLEVHSNACTVVCRRLRPNFTNQGMSGIIHHACQHARKQRTMYNGMISKTDSDSGDSPDSYDICQNKVVELF